MPLPVKVSRGENLFGMQTLLGNSAEEVHGAALELLFCMPKDQDLIAVLSGYSKNFCLKIYNAVYREIELYGSMVWFSKQQLPICLVTDCLISQPSW